MTPVLSDVDILSAVSDVGRECRGKWVEPPLRQWRGCVWGEELDWVGLIFAAYQQLWKGTHSVAHRHSSSGSWSFDLQRLLPSPIVLDSKITRDQSSYFDSRLDKV